MPDFKVFTQRTVRIVKQPTMTLQKTAGLSFNHAAYEALGAPEAVELMYDESAEIVGVRTCDPSSQHAYPVRSPATKRDKGFILSGRSFVNYYGIDTTVARRWNAYVEDGILCVDLRSESVEVTSNRNGRRARADTALPEPGVQPGDG